MEVKTDVGAYLLEKRTQTKTVLLKTNPQIYAGGSVLSDLP